MYANIYLMVQIGPRFDKLMATMQEEKEKVFHIDLEPRDYSCPDTCTNLGLRTDPHSCVTVRAI